MTRLTLSESLTINIRSNSVNYNIKKIQLFSVIEVYIIFHTLQHIQAKCYACCLHFRVLFSFKYTSHYTRRKSQLQAIANISYWIQCVKYKFANQPLLHIYMCQFLKLHVCHKNYTFCFFKTLPVFMCFHFTKVNVYFAIT